VSRDVVIYVVARALEKFYWTSIEHGGAMRISRALPVAFALASIATAHDIPNERVDRSDSGDAAPAGRMRVDYEVSLSELTLVQDLRRLVEVVGAADRSTLFDRYGREPVPLNAKGFLLRLMVERSPCCRTA